MAPRQNDRAKAARRFIHVRLREARQFLHDQNYVQAREQTSRAIRQYSREPIQVKIDVLDHHIEALKGLELYTVALATASTMRDMAPDDGRPYLRIGQIHRIRGNPQAALEAYRDAIGRNTSMQSEIRREASSVSAMLNMLTRRDPMAATFPPEIRLKIFGHLETRDLVACCAVSRQWRDELRAGRDYWKELSFDNKIAGSHFQNVRRVMSLAGAAPCSVLFDRCYRIFNRLVAPPFAFPPGIRRLRLLMNRGYQQDRRQLGDKFTTFSGMLPESLTELDAEFELRVGDFFRLLTRLPRLRVLRSISYTSDSGTSVATVGWPVAYELAEVKLRAVAHARSFREAHDLLQRFLERCPGLRTLQLEIGGISENRPTPRLDLTSLTRLDRFRLHHSDTTLFPLLPSSVRILELDSIKFSSLATEQWQQDLPCLSHFRCHASASAQEGEGAMQLLLHNRAVHQPLPLRSVSFSSNPGEFGSDFVSLATGASSRGLSHLDLSDQAGVGDNILDLLVANCPDLTDLELEKSDVTGAGVHRLVKARGATLRRLNLVDCTVRVSGDLVAGIRQTLPRLAVFYRTNGRMGKSLWLEGYSFDDDLRFM